MTDTRPLAPLVVELCRLGREAGLAAVGVASAEPFEDTRRVLEARKAEGRHGGMAFTYRNPARSTDPTSALASARSLVVGAQAYRSDTPTPPEGRARGRVARYVHADAYGALGRALEVVARRLRDDGYQAVVVADQNTLVDRAAAHRAGLGWYGKSSNLLLPGQGSWFVLGSVVTDARLPAADGPLDDGCGTCRRCIDGCPTGAIVAPGVVDARRCLAWLVQSPDPFPVEHREALGDRLYGCDDCQEVCPPNRRAVPPTGDDGGARSAWVDIVDLLDSDDATLLDRHGRWYIPRRDPRYLRRTALVVLGNIGDADDERVRRAIERYRTGGDPLLAEHATWAAARLGLLPHVASAEAGG